MESTIVLPYAASLALVLIALSVNVSRLRQKHQVGIGTGQVPELKRAVRAHANFCEYVPLALVVLVLLELGANAPGWALHALAAALLAGRVSHALGLSRSAGASLARQAGTALTWVVLLVAAGTGLGAALGGGLAAA